jgi:hypothetical protein
MSGFDRLERPRGPWVHRLAAPGPPALAALRARPPGWVVREIDGRRAATKPDLLDLVAGAFDFPATFGRNWDALEDSLADLGWLAAPGYLLIVTEAEALLRGEPAGGDAALGTFLAVLRAVGRSWATARGGADARPAAPFHAVLLTRAGSRPAPPRLAALPRLDRRRAR